MSHFGTRNYYLEVAAGRVPGSVFSNASGTNEDIDTGTLPEDIWAEGGVWVPPTAARTHDIVSTSTNDTSAGTGMRTLLLQGLDSSYEPQFETITMNGTTNVPTANTYTRINSLVGLTAGSVGSNDGIIRATAQTDATVQAHMPAGWSKSSAAIYSVASTQQALVTEIFISLNNLGAGASGDIVDLDLYIRTGIDTATPVLVNTNRLGLHTRATSSQTYVFNVPSAIPASSDLIIRCADASSDNLNVTAAFGFVLETL